MEKNIFFISLNPERGIINGTSCDDKTTVGGGSFNTAVSVKLPKHEIDRFKKENTLQFNEQYNQYTLGGKNPVLLLKNCNLDNISSINVRTYIAKSWEWA